MDSALATRLTQSLRRFEGLTTRKLFGYPAFFIRGKVVACVYAGGVAAKLPEATARRLVAAGRASEFRPYGTRRMREWVHVPVAGAMDYDHALAVVRRSIAYVSRIRRRGSPA